MNKMRPRNEQNRERRTHTIAGKKRTENMGTANFLVPAKRPCESALLRDLKLERLKRFKSRPNSPDPEPVLRPKESRLVSTRLDLYNNCRDQNPLKKEDLGEQLTRLEEAEVLWDRLKRTMRHNGCGKEKSGSAFSLSRTRLNAVAASTAASQELSSVVRGSQSRIDPIGSSMSRPKSRVGAEFCTNLKYVSAREPSAGNKLMDIVLAVKAGLDNCQQTQRKRADTYFESKRPAAEPRRTLGENRPRCAGKNVTITLYDEEGRGDISSQVQEELTRKVQWGKKSISFADDPGRRRKGVLSLKLQAAKGDGRLESEEDVMAANENASFEDSSAIKQPKETKQPNFFFIKENKEHYKSVIRQNYRLAAAIGKSARRGPIAPGVTKRTSAVPRKERAANRTAVCTSILV